MYVLKQAPAFGGGGGRNNNNSGASTGAGSKKSKVRFFFASELSHTSYIPDTPILIRGGSVFVWCSTSR